MMPHRFPVIAAAVCVALVLTVPSALAQSADEMTSAAKPVTKPAPARGQSPKKSRPAKSKATKAQPAPSKSKAPRRKAKAPATLPTSDAPAAAAKPVESRSVPVGSLPGPIVALHNCAPVKDRVSLVQETYAKSVLFFVSCPAKERGGYELQAVYEARDAKGAGARRVTFEVPGADGAIASVDAIPSAIPAREAYFETVEERKVVRVRNAPAWITGAWRPDDREGVCSAVGHWRVANGKAELWLWEEARECPKDGAPKYETKIDKKPPPLVGR
jgi:hypothetical protein